jgi:hypothetical protein
MLARAQLARPYRLRDRLTLHPHDRPRAASGISAYAQAVIATNPIAYWIMGETAGSTAACQMNALNNGTYTGVTLNNTTGPDGVTGAPFFDGINDMLNVKTANFIGNWDPDEHTVMIWAKVYNAGVWTDGATRIMWQIVQDGSNYSQCRNPSAPASRMTGYEIWNGGSARTKTSMSDTDWMHIVSRRSKSASNYKFFYNGASWGSGNDNPNAGATGLTKALIGVQTPSPPTNVWHGWLAHAAVWDSALSDATILSLAST